jgi:hypothetical protein
MEYYLHELRVDFFIIGFNTDNYKLTLIDKLTDVGFQVITAV